jgi:hypothetical protein
MFKEARPPTHFYLEGGCAPLTPMMLIGNAMPVGSDICLLDELFLSFPSGSFAAGEYL